MFYDTCYDTSCQLLNWNWPSWSVAGAGFRCLRTSAPLVLKKAPVACLEQDADCIIFLWRGEYYSIAEYEDGTPTADTILFDIAKHRNGAIDEVITACSLRRGVFGNCTSS